MELGGSMRLEMEGERVALEDGRGFGGVSLAFMGEDGRGATVDERMGS